MSSMREEYAFCAVDWAASRQRLLEMIEILRLAITRISHGSSPVERIPRSILNCEI
jgi:hypothetical protein